MTPEQHQEILEKIEGCALGVAVAIVAIVGFGILILTAILTTR